MAISAHIVAHHLRPSFSSDIPGLYRCPSSLSITSIYPCCSLRLYFRPLSLSITSIYPCCSLRLHSRPLSLSITSARPSSVTISAHIVAHHPHLALLLSSVTISAHIVARHLRPSLFGDDFGPYRCPSPPSSPAAFPGYVSGQYRCPTPPPVPLRLHFCPISLPITSAHPSPATFSAHIVARHLHPSLSGDIPGLCRCPSPPPVPLR